MADKKTIFYAGAAIAIVVVLYLLFKSSATQAPLTTALNEQVPTGGTLNEVLNSVGASGLLGSLSSAFSGIGGSNDAGLYSASDPSENDPGIDDEDDEEDDY